MAIAYQSSSTNYFTDLATTCTVTAPSGISDGDALIAIGTCIDARTLSPPAGWTSLVSGAAYGEYAIVWYRKASSDSGDYQFTSSGTYSTGMVTILRYTGVLCDSTSDFVAVLGNNSTNDQTGECPDITSPGSGVILWASLKADGSSSSCSRTATERVDYTNSLPGNMAVWEESIGYSGTVTGAVITHTGYGGSRTASVHLSPIPDETLNQHSFRFFNDAGSESAATVKAALNTNINLSANDIARIRFLLDATGDPVGKQFQLEYRKKPSGGSFGPWTEVN